MRSESNTRDAVSAVSVALVRRLGGKVTLSLQELEDARMFNATANEYDDRLTIATHLPALLKEESRGL